jgi:phage tail tape-measure protein
MTSMSLITSVTTFFKPRTQPQQKTLPEQNKQKNLKKDTVYFSGKHSFLGDTNAEKEAKDAKDAFDDARHDPKVSDAERRRLKAEYEEADQAADRAKALKKGIEYAGTIGGTALGTKIGLVLGGGGGAAAGSAAGPAGTVTGGALGGAKGGAIGGTIGGTLGNAATAPVAHYVAEATHAVKSKEFQKGYKETRKSGELCIVM